MRRRSSGEVVRGARAEPGGAADDGDVVEVVGGGDEVDHGGLVDVVAVA
jgi:hypothetical protein